MVKILVKKFNKNIKLPVYKTSGSSGMDLIAYVKNKKYCDWIIANDVSNSEIGFNSEYNAVSIIYDNKVEKIEKNLKSYIANKIAKKIINNFIQ